MDEKVGMIKMQSFQIDGIEVIVEDLPDITKEEIKEYVEYVRYRIYGRLEKLIICQGDTPGSVRLDWSSRAKFERIRRITGYLVGTIDRWNNAKRAEEHDRVKHIGGRK